LQNSKGPGNFRNLLLYTPGGKADSVKLIPVAEIAAKDDFLSRLLQFNEWAGEEIIRFNPYKLAAC
jgi:capsid portal protein